MSEILAAKLSDLTPEQPKAVSLNETPVVLVRIGDEVHALGDVCTHQGGPLSEGRLVSGRLACPWHGWRFDLRSGQCTMPARGGAVPSYPVRIEGGEVWVDVP